MPAGSPVVSEPQEEWGERSGNPNPNLTFPLFSPFPSRLAHYRRAGWQTRVKSIYKLRFESNNMESLSRGQSDETFVSIHAVSEKISRHQNAQSSWLIKPLI